MMKSRCTVRRLSKKGDALWASLQSDEKGEREEPVRLVYGRPVSARDGEIAVMEADGSKELAWLVSLEDLDPDSRELARETLWQSYRMAKIDRVVDSHVNHGHRYLKVETDRGPRYFNLKEPGNNVTYLTSDHLVIRDSMGNRYEVESLRALDEESRERLDRVL